MKKLLSVILTALMAFGSVGCSAGQADKAEDNSSGFGVKLSIDGEIKNLAAYNIENNNYFKLRDIANVLKGTKAHFDVSWNSEKNAIELLSNTDYSTDEEISAEMLENPVAEQRNTAIYMDNAKILMKAYDIAGNNYFKLRDLASAVNFNVDWNAEKEVIEIDTSKGYAYPAQTSGDFALNPKFLSFMGMTKAFIDDKCGNKGNYNSEFGLSDYGSGLMVGYGVLGSFDAPKDADRASTLYISLDNLFFNCPETLTVALIKSVFPETKSGYNEMDDENLLFANYCGTAIEFYPDYAMDKNSYACIRSDGEYVSEKTKTVQVITNPNTASKAAPVLSKAPADLYREYAKAHDSEFWSINKDWSDENNCYYIADVDHDGSDELVVQVGCGIAVYKEANGNAEQVFYDRLPDSSGNVHYWLARYNNEYYIIYTSAGSSEYRKLLVLKENSLETVKESMIINFSEYNINNAVVSQAEYENYINSISYPQMVNKDNL